MGSVGVRNSKSIWKMFFENVHITILIMHMVHVYLPCCGTSVVGMYERMYPVNPQ